MAQARGQIRLHGFSKRVADGRYIAVYLQPYLVVQGHSHREARTKLDALLQAYLEDATQDGRLHAALERRAPLSYRLEVWLSRLVHLLRRSHTVESIRKTCCIPQHA